MVPDCRLGCVFCTTPQAEGSFEASTLEGSLAALSEARADGMRGVLLTGGEPSELRWLLPLIREARSLGFESVRMQSHCGVASDPLAADALASAGLTGVDAPVYGSHERVHEEITQTRGSWRCTMEGLRRLQEREIEIVVHNTLFRSNLGDLRAWRTHVEALAPTGAYLQLTAAVGPEGVYGRIAPRWEELKGPLVQALEGWDPPFAFFLSDVPECIVPSLSSMIHEERTDGPVRMPYLDWLDRFLDGGARVHVDACERCVRAGVCAGVSREVVEILKDVDALSPLGGES